MPSNPVFSGNFQLPGIEAKLQTVTNQFWYGRFEDQIWFHGIISGAARDAGNTVTSVLRSGLLLGQIASSGKLKEWDPAAIDGSQYIYGILGQPQEVVANGSDRDAFVGQILIGGHVKAANVIEPGQATLGIVGEDYEYAVYSQLQHRIRFDNQVFFDSNQPIKTRHLAVADTAGAGITLTAADVGKLIVTRGSAAQTVVLPDPKIGYEFEVLSTVDQNLSVVTASGENVIAVNNATADGVIFSTASNKIGARVRFTAINTVGGTFYVYQNVGGTTLTVVDA